MATYNTPGVYVEEIPSLPGSIPSVPTAVPGFVGYTAKAGPGKPVKIESLAAFEAIFGGAYMEVVGTAFPAVTTPGSAIPAFLLHYSLRLYFANGGGPCYISSAGPYPASPARAAQEIALAALALEDEVTILVLPDAVNLIAAEQTAFYETALAQCTSLKDRILLVDANKANYNAVDTAKGHIRSINAGSFPNALSYVAAYYPFVQTNLGYPDSAIKLHATPYSLADVVAGLHAGPTDFSILVGTLRQNIAALPKVILPPSPAIAGVMCVVDKTRGVWKAPANVSLVGVTDPTERLSDAQNALLNVDSGTGKSINAIRAFNGKGTLVWGARTMDGNDNEWRYIPVRRLFNMMEESISQAMEVHVFSPNDHQTWAHVKGSIENFLLDLWKQGALAGAKPEQAFRVRVGLDQTMTSLDILEGRLIVEVAVAAVRPAEFIILRFSHLLQSV
jgi:uncharacterized protein